MPRSHGVGWGGYVNVPSTKFLRPCARCWCHDHMEWGGDVITFLRSRSLDLAQDVDATLTWGGVGWGGYVNVPSTKFPRPCARCWCHDHMEWGGDVITFLRSRSLDLAQDVDATLTWGGVGWVLMLKFLRPRSLDLAQDVDATLTWGGVGWVLMLKFLRPGSLDLAQDVDATLTLGGVGWGHANVDPTLHKTLMLHQWGGVAWGDDNAHTTLRKMLMLCPRWSNYHGLRWGGVGAFCSNF